MPSDVTRARWIGIEFGDGALDISLGGAVGEVNTDRGDAYLGAVPMLATDIGMAAGVVAYQNGSESWGNAARLQRLNPDRKLGLDVARGLLAVKKCGGHDVSFCRTQVSQSRCLH